jgi:hypothetical protein
MPLPVIEIRLLRTCLKMIALPLEPSGYIQVFLDGGLNQQRMGVMRFNY